MDSEYTSSTIPAPGAHAHTDRLSFLESFTRMLASASRFLRALRWLFREAIWSRKFKVGALCASDFLSTTLEASTFAWALLYIRVLESNDPLYFMGQQMVPRESFVLLLSTAAAMFFSFALAGLLRFAFARGVARFDVDSERILGEQLLGLVASGDGTPPTGGRRVKELQFLVNTLGHELRMVGMSLRLLLLGFGPLLTFLAAVVALAITSLTLTAYLAGLLLLFAPFGIVLARRTSAVATAYHQSAQAASVARRDLAIATLYTNLASHRQVDSPSRLTAQPFMTVDANYTEWLIADDRFAFLSQLLKGVGISLLILYFGYAILTGPFHWQTLAVYVVVLRYCLQSLQTLAITAGSFNRFYPTIRALQQFLTMPATGSLSSKAAARSADASATPLRASSTLIASSFDINLLTIGRLRAVLADATPPLFLDPASGTFWLCHRDTFLGDRHSLDELFEAAGGMKTRDTVRSLLPTVDTARFPDLERAEFTRPLKLLAWRKLPLAMRSLLILSLINMLPARNVVFLDCALISPLTSEVRRTLLQGLRRSHVILTTIDKAAIADAAKFDVETVIVVSSRRVLRQLRAEETELAALLVDEAAQEDGVDGSITTVDDTMISDAGLI